MPCDSDSFSTMNDSTASGDSSSGNLTVPTKSTAKKKRNLPGMPDPEAEVIALSPKTLLATNRFVCEICSKGFQRDQNLQLHRRGHNLPWKLRQRSTEDVKKRVYVCPEPGCIHHSPSRALGDLTGIKKHFCRKHGEKKWKCEKCSKNYAVKSDWKAHSKICGSREYKCDCGTLFLRRDSFITHRAFCDALSGECAKKNTAQAPPSTGEDPKIQSVMPSPPPPAVAAPSPPPPPPQASPSAPPSTAIMSSVLPLQNLELPERSSHNPTTTRIFEETSMVSDSPANCSSNSLSSINGSTGSNVHASLFASSTSSRSLQPQAPRFPNIFETMARSKQTSDVTLCTPSEPLSLCLAMNQGSSIFKTAGQECRQYTTPPQPAMSATALLQKAAQVGVAASNASVLRGLGLVSSLPPSSEPRRWDRQEIESEGASLASGLGLGLACDGGSALTELMLGTPSVFGPKHATLDLLGLGMAASSGPTGGLSAIMQSINDGLDVAAAAAAFGGGEYSGKDMGRSS